MWILTNLELKEMLQMKGPLMFPPFFYVTSVNRYNQIKS